MALDVTVRDNPEESRYELLVGEDVSGVIVYETEPGALVLVHTEVSSELEGRGLGAQLVSYALADMRARGLSLVPMCPFVTAYVRRHPEEADLAEDETQPR